jgi:hypothetical protein
MCGDRRRLETKPRSEDRSSEGSVAAQTVAMFVHPSMSRMLAWFRGKASFGAILLVKSMSKMTGRKPESSLLHRKHISHLTLTIGMARYMHIIARMAQATNVFYS